MQEGILRARWTDFHVGPGCGGVSPRTMQRWRRSPESGPEKERDGSLHADAASHFAYAGSGIPAGSTRTKTVRSASTAIGGFEREVASRLPLRPRHTHRGSRCQWTTGISGFERCRAVLATDRHSTHNVFRTWGTRENGKSGLAFRRECCCLFVACSERQTMGVNHLPIRRRTR